MDLNHVSYLSIKLLYHSYSDGHHKCQITDHQTLILHKYLSVNSCKQAKFSQTLRSCDFGRISYNYIYFAIIKILPREATWVMLKDERETKILKSHVDLNLAKSWTKSELLVTFHCICPDSWFVCLSYRLLRRSRNHSTSLIKGSQLDAFCP